MLEGGDYQEPNFKTFLLYWLIHKRFNGKLGKVLKSLFTTLES